MIKIECRERDGQMFCGPVDGLPCPFCSGKRPRGYRTCGASECQQRDFETNRERTKRTKRAAKRGQETT